MKTLDQMFGLEDGLVEVRPPRAKAAFKFRYPSFSEWHELASAHRSLKGSDPSADLIARTVAIVLADDKGERLYADADIPKLMESSPRTLIWFYVKAWDTVLRNDEQAVRAEEGK